MKFLAGIPLFFLFSLAARGQQLQLIPDAIIKGKPYIVAFAHRHDGGYFFSTQIDHVDDERASSLTKTDQDGKVDVSFGKVEANSHILSIHELPDGKILIGGWFTEINGITVGPVVRLNADGTLDDTFTRWMDMPSFSYASRFAVQSNGKIVVVGSFSGYLGSSYRNIVRLNQDGTVDESFGLNVTNLPFVPFIEVNENDELAVTSGFKLYKLTKDGQVHPDFPPLEVGGGASFYHFKFSKDGGILVGGSFESFAGVPVNRIARITSTGSVDASFNPGKFINYLWDLDVKGVDTLVVATTDGLKIFDGEGNAIRVEGLAAYSVEAIFVDNSDNVFLHGGFRQINGFERPYFVRLTNEFAFDQSFSTAFSYTTGIKKIVAQRDGKILVAGGFHGINDTPASLVRINLDGSVDASFAAETSSAYATCIALQDDGKLLVTTSDRLQRLMPSGELDKSFQDGVFRVTAGYVYLSSVAVHMNKIYISGLFDSFNGHSTAGIVRLNMDGTLDNTFRSNLPPSTYIATFNFQSGHRIVAAGLIRFPEGEKRLVRLAENGSVDGTFSSGHHSSNSILQIRIDKKDRIYLAGDFLDFNGQEVSGMMKLTPDGSPDKLFQPPYSPPAFVQFPALEIISDNRISIGSSSPGVGFFVMDSTGQIIETEYGSAEARAGLTTSFFDGKTLFLGGRLLTPDLQTVAGIAYVNFTPVDGAVKNVEATRISSSTIHLTWENHFSNADALVLERSINNNTSYAQIQTLSSALTAYEDETAAGANTYYYRIRAANSGSLSAYSNEVFIDKLIVGTAEERRPTVAVYPNPTQGLLHINAKNSFYRTARILNAMGDEVATTEVIDSSIDMAPLAAGVYVLVLDAGNRRRWHIRVIKK